MIMMRAARYHVVPKTLSRRNAVTAAKYDARPDKMNPILAASTAPQETSLKMTENPRANPTISTTAPAIKVFGAAKLDIFYNSARPQAPGVPFFLVPRFAGGFRRTPLISTLGSRS